MKIPLLFLSTFPLLIGGNVRTEESQGEFQYVPYSTRKVAQITGDYDHGWRKPTPTQTASRGIFYTDLGSSFEHKGQLYFLFGDTFSSLNEAEEGPDFVAVSDSTNPFSLELEFFEDERGQPVPIDIPGIREGVLEVPTHGVSIDGDIYLVFATESDGMAGPDMPGETQMRKSYLTRSHDDGQTWERLYLLSEATGDDDFSEAKFINVAFARPTDPSPWKDALPESAREDPVFLFGTGEYRKSDLYLAVTSARTLDDPDTLQFLTGWDEGGAPLWGKNQSDAATVIANGTLGEFSATYLPEIEQWAVTYSVESVEDAAARGVYLHFADQPWGPFREPQKIFDAWRDRGYTEFLHVADTFGIQDTVHDPGREFSWGGEYAPYLVDRFTEVDETGLLHLYYTLSTWNPYQVVLLRSSFSRGTTERKRPEPFLKTTMPGGEGWNHLSDEAFYSVKLSETGEPFLLSEGDGGQQDRGVLWRQVPSDDRTRRLEFEIWGGDLEAILLEGGEEFPKTILPEEVPNFYDALKRGKYGRIARVANGLRSWRFRRKVLWGLEALDRSQLRLVVIDPVSRNWGSGALSVVQMTNTALDRIGRAQQETTARSGDGRIARLPGTLSFDDPDWQLDGPDAARFFLEYRYGRRYLTTLTDKGFAATGTVSRLLAAEAEKTFLEFFLSGTDARVFLIRGEFDPTNPEAAEVVESASGAGGLMPGHRIVWPIPPGDESLSLVVFDSPSEPGVDRFLSISEPRRYREGSGPIEGNPQPFSQVTSRTVEVGTSEWTLTDPELAAPLFENGKGGITTFTPDEGDASTGAMWLELPPKYGAKRLSFEVTGAGGRVVLSRAGEEPMTAERIAEGELGEVLFSASGNENATPVPVTWDIEGVSLRGTTLIVLDEKRSAWGFLTVTDFTIE